MREVTDLKAMVDREIKHERRSSHILGAALLLGLAQITVASDGSLIDPQVERGQYLATAGNCVTCHTSDDGQGFAGGVAFETSFGTLYSTNITPDRRTGIGNWTQQDFTRALRQGVRPNGEHLYPAFPYTSFTKMSDEDAAALFAYLRTIRPVSAVTPANDMRFPFNQRRLLGIWKKMFFAEGRFTADSQQSLQWNRGAYLVEGLGHCGLCHTPRNFLGGEKVDLAMTGATYRDKVESRALHWSASNLTSAPSGLGAWSVEEIAAYLKTGISTRAGVFGPMNDVVVSSTRHLSDSDTRAIAVYLRSLPAKEQDLGAPVEADVRQQGASLYDIHCGTCHLPTGLGSEDTGPPLVGSAIALAPDPASLINITLYGAQIPHMPPSDQWKARQWQAMEAFGQKLSDEDAATLLSYVRSAWGNQAGLVTSDQVMKQR